MTLDIVIDSDAEWDSSHDWAALAQSAVAAAIAESAFPALDRPDRPGERFRPSSRLAQRVTQKWYGAHPLPRVDLVKAPPAAAMPYK